MGMFDDLIPAEGANPKGDARDQIGKPEELTFAEKLVSGVKLPAWMENIRGSAPARVIQGMADPAIGAMQAVANVLPDATGIPQAVNKRVSDLESSYQTERRAAGGSGADISRIVGNVLSPVNAIPAGRLAEATTAGARAAQGAMVGAAGGLTAPVADTKDGYWGKKAGEVVLGAATGAALTPVLGAVAESAMRRLGIGRGPAVRASSHDVDGALADALGEAGQRMDDLHPDQLASLRQQVASSLENGQTLDAKAALRKADFESLGMQPTQAQITRDPMAFAREQNLSGVAGVGDDLAARFAAQPRQLQGRLPADEAKNLYQAGNDITGSLSSIDDKLRGHVSGLYNEARASAGKDLDVPLQGLAQDASRIFRQYGERPELSGVRNVLDDLGVFTGKQTKTFTLEDANGLLQVINKNRSNDPAVRSALGELRQAVRGAIEGADSSGGPFAPAVKAAAERFKMHDAIPALKAVARGDVEPDTFVSRFIVNGRTDDVRGLAMVLKQADPGAFQEARAQVADELRRAAFGEVNRATGDAAFSPARYMQTLRRMGPDKLQAFFSPEEVRDIMTVGRVGSYINAAPAASKVNRSNTSSAAANMLSAIPGLRQAGAVVNRLVSPVQDRNALRAAMRADVPVEDAPLTDAQRNYLSYLMSIAGGTAGAAAR